MSVVGWALDALWTVKLDPDHVLWSRADTFLTRTQNREVFARGADERALEASLRDGGFAFGPRFSKAGQEDVGQELVVYRSYGSATADGIRGLVASSNGDLRDERLDAALRWIARNYNLEKNPGFQGDPVGWSFGIHY